MRVLIVTGGTGGHIYPALALAEAIKKDDGNNTILFVGSNDRMESHIIPESGYDYKGIDVVGTNGNIFRKIYAVLLLKKAEKVTRKIITDFKPDIVIGFGNYISVPVIMSAHKLGIPTLIHEQNSSAGKANKLLAKYATGVVGCYKENLEQFPKDKTRLYGNPRASLANQTVKNAADITALGLNSNLPLVSIMMGSLGSESINKILVAACKLFEDKPYQVIIATGKNNYDSFDFKSTKSIKILPYVDGLKVMANADLCVCRAGATTLAELLALAKPSIIIPSPYVPNNHQVKNALVLKKAQASIMIEEKDLNAEKLVESIDKLISDKALLAKMGENAKALATVNASDDIIRWMKELSK